MFLKCDLCLFYGFYFGMIWLVNLFCAHHVFYELFYSLCSLFKNNIDSPYIVKNNYCSISRCL
ncbi:hypothetical protein DT994_21350 [Salmonella enterica]|nr:hypothetical protein [Salmonella enterica subsp. houtenae serovar 48:g,z51:-]